jgi:hypothetical protein
MVNDVEPPVPTHKPLLRSLIVTTDPAVCAAAECGKAAPASRTIAKTRKALQKLLARKLAPFSCKYTYAPRKVDLCRLFVFAGSLRLGRRDESGGEGLQLLGLYRAQKAVGPRRESCVQLAHSREVKAVAFALLSVRK